MTDDELRLDVATELFWDPKVNAGQVAVSAEDGTVTLRGTVGSFRQKREAGYGCPAPVWGDRGQR
jgi:osmotically-inducible protein OsmY